MITGVHVLLYVPEAERVRAYVADVLGFPSVDAGGGWLIFGLPPAELGVHPTDGKPHHELSLMCDDLDATMRALEAKGAQFTQPVRQQSWGRSTAIALPGGGELGLYEPRHPKMAGRRPDAARP